MSGGAFEYFYYKLEEIANLIYEHRSKEEIILSDLLRDLSEVLHDLEWYRSGDTDFEDFKKSFDKFKNKWLKK